MDEAESVTIKNIKKMSFFSTKYFGALAGIFAILITLVAFRTVENNATIQAQQQTVLVSEIFENDVLEAYWDIEDSLSHILKSSQFALRGNPEDWDVQTIFYIDNVNGIENIVLIDRDMRIHRTMPHQSDSYRVDTYINHQDIIDNHLNITAAIYADDKIEGFILTDISIEGLMMDASEKLAGDYMVSLSKNDIIVYNSDSWQQSKHSLKASGTIVLDDTNLYEYVLKPTDDFMSKITYFAYQILVLGLIFSVGVVTATLVAQSYVRKNIQLAEAQANLIAHQTELEGKNTMLQGQLKNQQKLESIGTLASGVAHEINNPINGIMNYSQIILDASDKDSPNVEYAQEIIHETQRVSTLVRSLLQYSRREKVLHSLARIEDIIDHTVLLMNTLFRQDDIKLTIDIKKGLPSVRCHSQQIQQVLMNLLTNARDALNEKYPAYDDEKEIILRCRTANKEGKRYIRVTVEDHGTGIPESVQDKIFDQFFTTKDTDKGTGLGLPISYNIVKEHKGELYFETKQGQYTRFHMELLLEDR